MDRFNLKTRLAYFTDCEGLFRDAYEAYLKKGQPCLIPGIGKRAEVIWPMSTLHWLVTLTDNVLSMRGSFREIGQIDWAGYSYDSRKCLTDSWLISPPDTVLRETNRTHSFGHRLIVRKVLVDNLKSPVVPIENGNSRGASTIDPFGRETPAVFILSLSLPTCYDTGVFEDPHKFNPWRFAKRRQAQNQGQGHGDSADNKQDDSKCFAQSIVTYNSIIIIQHGNPSPQHPLPNLPFGHGRHSLTNLVHMNLKK
ncbi:hypothetical protein ACO22_01812 [Paracoccidioides brasiliensis]|uniref:Uncharacterized protein n=1 Tax=Paracoccidioides brasiliensis TaxID=121759 RepID=A0A1D2JKH0_PARBR|nr:hypothetical protein ACO22_01812 [Paracoccidioides brasiliensis]